MSTYNTRTAESILENDFPDRHKFKINWLQFEQDLRDALCMTLEPEVKLYVLDALLCEHTGRGTELPEWKQ